MPYFNIVAETNENTVVTEYEPQPRKPEDYQSEAALEREFIKLLSEQGYEDKTIHSQDELVANLRVQLEKLNNYRFSENEWQQLFTGFIANPNEHIAEKTRKIQEDPRYTLTRDDGTSKNITLIDRKQIHNNYLQVIDQLVMGKEQGARYDNRYDVTILVNGLPLVHVELKRRGVAIREAFNQINRYQRDSFWAGYGLFEYVQIFVISNGTNTKYYSNSTRLGAIKEQDGASTKQKSSHSFEFTSFWADSNNKVIPDLMDFTRTFFARHTLLNILTKYCVFTSENQLLVMRPYQITATERILNRIAISTNYRKYGSIEAGGYIWHTTGSGKTLTSFKTARIASQLPDIDKVLFVVDRKDLDYQTMKEYDRFEKGCANSNTSTAILKKQLEDPNARIIITTIQKLSNFVNRYKEHEVYGKHMVLIFDECHRSQFGDMRNDIVRSFKKYHIFGFTGTPIFAVNANKANIGQICTTEQAFGDQLHTYTIVDAINDKNVLPFRVDYVSTMDADETMEDEEVYDIQREKAYMAPERITKVTAYILDHFDQKTYRTSGTNYTFNRLLNITEVAKAKRDEVKEEKNVQHIKGFNAILAVASVPMAKLYYDEFRKQMEADPSKKLRVATIFSYGANEAEADGILDEENPEDTSALDQPSRDFLEKAIKDYNGMFGTNYDTSSDKFQNYYKDVSLRMKNKELDLLIVVNMFLTGFDATTLNTLWVDKNLKMHGLIQAFSRTNRILNSIKTFGNIVCFRNLQKRVDSAIALFGDKNASGIVLLRPFKDYYEGYDEENGKHHDGYAEMVNRLINEFPLTQPQIVGEQAQKDFIALFGAILRMRNLLASFDEFQGNGLINERDMQDYLGRYQDLRDEWREKMKREATDITDDIVFEVELIKQIEINIDYILMLVKKYHDSNCEDKEVLVDIHKAIDSSPELRSKKDLIETFIANVNEMEDVYGEWHSYIAEEREKELVNIIQSEHLKEAETRRFVENAFRDGEIKTTGTDIDSIMPPTSRFGGGKRAAKKQTIIEKLKAFFERFFGIG